MPTLTRSTLIKGWPLIRRPGWSVWERWRTTGHATLASDGYQEALVRVTARYRPNVIVVRQGTPVRLNFRRETAGDCTAEVMLAEFGKHATLPIGATVPVEFVPDWPGTYGFWCGLGMARGTIIVK